MGLPAEKLESIKRQATRAIDFVITEVVMEGLAQEPTIRRLEVSLANSLWDKFTKRAQASINRGLATLNLKPDKPYTEKDVRKYLDAFGKEYSEFPKDVEPTINRLTPAMYDQSRKIKPVRKALIGLDYNLIDSQARAHLKKESMWWVGDHYDTVLRNRLTTMTRHSMIEKGLGRVEAAKDLRKSLQDNIIKGKMPAITMPKGWTGTDKQYFEALSGNISNRASNFGTITNYQEAGFETFEIAAIIDRRTSQICQLMNGKTFTVDQGADLRDRIMGAENPTQLKNIAGWMRGKEAGSAFGIKPGVAATPAQSKAMAGKGMALPPYHFRCRTVIIPGAARIPRRESLLIREGRIKGYEKEIAKLKREKMYALDAKTGEGIFQKVGSETSINFTDAEILLFEDTIGIHNHPLSGGSFSLKDIMFTLRTGMAESRVTTKKYNYFLDYDKTKGSLSALGENKFARLILDIEQEYGRLDIIVKSKLRLVYAGKINASEANLLYGHEMMKGMVKKYPWMKYRRELRR